MYPWYDAAEGKRFESSACQLHGGQPGKHPVSTNTYKNMPTPDVFRILNGESDGPVVLNMSPDGKLLAVGG